MRATGGQPGRRAEGDSSRAHPGHTSRQDRRATGRPGLGAEHPLWTFTCYGDAPVSGPSYAQSRAIREAYLARLAKIEYEERLGKLISRDEVQVAAFNKFRMFRDGMLNIPTVWRPC